MSYLMKTIKPHGDDSKLWLCLTNEGVFLIIEKDGLIVEAAVDLDDFTELSKRWQAQDFDKDEADHG